MLRVTIKLFLFAYYFSHSLGRVKHVQYEIGIKLTSETPQYSVCSGLISIDNNKLVGFAYVGRILDKLAATAVYFDLYLLNGFNKPEQLFRE